MIVVCSRHTSSSKGGSSDIEGPDVGHGDGHLMGQKLENGTRLQCGGLADQKRENKAYPEDGCTWNEMMASHCWSWRGLSFVSRTMTSGASISGRDLRFI